MKLHVFSDLHLGVQRTGGTTLSSAAALREYAQAQYRRLLESVGDGDDVFINGDLTDSFAIPLNEALEVYFTTSSFLASHPNSKLTLACGNHDLSKSSTTLGAVQFIGALLGAAYPNRFRLMLGPGWIGKGLYVIPHRPNQEVFDQDIARLPEDVKHLFLHCNYDSVFACDTDHSLNLSRDQAKALRDRGVTMVLGHEHQQRDLMGGSVVIVGAQFPTSVSDCLGNETKRCLVIEDERLSFPTTWSVNDADGWFMRVNWEALEALGKCGRGFVRVEGEATAAQAADVIKAISAFRQRSDAFVVTNAVRIEQIDSPDDLSASVDEIKALSVLDLLLEALTEEQQATVRTLLAESD